MLNYHPQIPIEECYRDKGGTGKSHKGVPGAAASSRSNKPCMLKLVRLHPGIIKIKAGWWFPIFIYIFMFIPTWGNDPV